MSTFIMHAKALLSVLLVVLFALVLSSGIMFGITKYDCTSYGELVEKDTKVVSLECYVKAENGWVKRETYELTQVFRKQ